MKYFIWTLAAFFVITKCSGLNVDQQNSFLSYFAKFPDAEISSPEDLETDNLLNEVQSKTRGYRSRTSRNKPIILDFEDEGNPVFAASSGSSNNGKNNSNNNQNKIQLVN